LHLLKAVADLQDLGRCLLAALRKTGLDLGVLFMQQELG